MTTKSVSVSILNLKQEERADVLRRLIKLGIKNLHVDVMDGRFVPNQAISIAQTNQLKKLFPGLIFDVHLMVEDPEDYIARLDRQIEFVIIHFESLKETDLVSLITRWRGIFKIGLAVKPATDLSDFSNLLPLLDLVLIMSVEPGFGGQEFILTSVEKISQLARLRDHLNLSFIIEVDGGINDKSAKLVRDAGVDWLVCGTYLLSNMDITTIKLLLG